jgi:hypothetical protein
MAEGKIYWNLPDQVSYQSGEKLSCTIIVVNPAPSSQEYRLIARLLSDSTVEREEAVLVNGEQTFTVDPLSRLELIGGFVADRTNVTLAILLCDKDGNELDRVNAFLSTPTWLVPSPAERIGEIMSQYMPFMVGGTFLVLIGALVIKLARR